MTEANESKTAHACDGSCEEHIGEVRPVHVVHIATGHDWGNFYYCDAAKEEDVGRGMRVEEI
jgi:hypothetical protein